MPVIPPKEFFIPPPPEPPIEPLAFPSQRVEDWRLRQAAGEEIFTRGLTSEEAKYGEDAVNLLVDRISRGVPVTREDARRFGLDEGTIWNAEIAETILTALETQIDTYGIQAHTPFYKELIVAPFEEEARLEEVRGAEAAEALRIKGQEAATTLQLRGLVENKQVWNQFNRDKEQILASDMTYDEKKGQLQNLVNELNTKVPLDELALYNLQLGARNDAFASLSPQEQTEVRTRVETGRGAMIEAGRVTPVTQARFERGFEQARPTTGPQYWRDWYNKTFSEQLRQFRATTELEGLGAKEVEESWADYLRRQKPLKREEFQRQAPFYRGERPSVFQPKIKTVGF